MTLTECGREIKLLVALSFRDSVSWMSVRRVLNVSIGMLKRSHATQPGPVARSVAGGRGQARGRGGLGAEGRSSHVAEGQEGTRQSPICLVSRGQHGLSPGALIRATEGVAGGVDSRVPVRAGTGAEARCWSRSTEDTHGGRGGAGGRGRWAAEGRGHRSENSPNVPPPRCEEIVAHQKQVPGCTGDGGFGEMSGILRSRGRDGRYHIPVTVF